jgi:plasmid stabilization system protein ParE
MLMQLPNSILANVSELAIDFLQSIQNALQLIAQYPQANPQIAQEIHRISAKRFPFYIYYTVDVDIVKVFAVLHVRRSPVSWQQRLE